MTANLLQGVKRLLNVPSVTRYPCTVMLSMLLYAIDSMSKDREGEKQIVSLQF